MSLPAREPIHNGTERDGPKFFKIGYPLPGSHEADLPVELFVGAQPGDIARALGGVLAEDRVDVVLNDQAARRVIAKTWAGRTPSIPFLARAVDSDSHGQGMLRLLDELYLSVVNPNALHTSLVIEALRTWHDRFGNLSWFTDSPTETLGTTSADGEPHISWQQKSDELEIELSTAISAVSAVLLVVSDSRLSIVGPVTPIKEDRIERVVAPWRLGYAVNQIDLVVQVDKQATSK